MSRVKSLHVGLLLLTVLSLTASPHLLADATPNVPPGYKLVNVPVGGNSIPILVKQQSDPLGRTSSLNSGTFHNQSSSFSEKNAMADKSFSYGSDAFAQRSADTQGKFNTKSYQDPAADGSTHIDTPTAHLPSAAGFNRTATGVDHPYTVAAADDQAHAFAGTSASPLQNRSAVAGGSDLPEKHLFASFADKQYLGPGAQNVPAKYNLPDNVVISRMSGLPNRPLSIDEVRNLINHGFTPDTDVKPEESSKPLNDPTYEPQPLRAMPATPSHVDDDDKDDAVPPPGMIADPANAEPLPQK